MAKLILGKTPETFKPFAVKFELPQGGEDQLTLTCKYRTRIEFAEFMDELYAGDAKPIDDAHDFVALFKRGGEKTAEHLAKFIVAWDLAEPVTPENLVALHNQAPAAAAAMTAAYGVACTEGRLGN